MFGFELEMLKKINQHPQEHVHTKYENFHLVEDQVVLPKVAGYLQGNILVTVLGAAAA